jgi:hypothetical protein
MADKTDTPNPGKTFKGQTFPPVRTVESVQAASDAQKPFDKPGAVSLAVYFAQSGIRNPVMQAGMRAFTSIQRATVEDWDAIFKSF